MKVNPFHLLLHSIKSKKNRIFIIPTRFGVLFTIIIIILLLISVSHDGTNGKILTVFLVTAGLMAMFMTHGNLENLTISVLEDSFQPEGQQGELNISIQAKNIFGRYAIEITSPKTSNSGNIQPINIENNVNQLTKLKTEKLPIGIFDLGQVKIATRYPLGLFYAWKWLEVKGSIVSYPKPEGHLYFLQSGKDRGKNSSIYRDLDDFSGHRNFQSGDNIRHIDWKALARGRPLLIKEFKGGSGARYIFRMSKLKNLTYGEQLSQMSLWIHDAHMHGATYAIETNKSMTAQSSGEAHFLRCLRELTACGKHRR